MSTLTSRLLYAALLGVAVAQLGWIDPLFLPLVLVGPLITGAVMAHLRVSYLWVATLWATAGLAMAASDWLVNREDVLFHLVLAVIMPLLAGIGFGAVWLTLRRPSPTT